MSETARPAWMDVATDHRRGGTEIVWATQAQYWFTVSCAPECRNAGPFLVWAPEGDNFFCAACGELMRRNAL